MDIYCSTHCSTQYLLTLVGVALRETMFRGFFNSPTFVISTPAPRVTNMWAVDRDVILPGPGPELGHESEKKKY